MKEFTLAKAARLTACLAKFLFDVACAVIGLFILIVLAVNYFFSFVNVQIFLDRSFQLFVEICLPLCILIMAGRLIESVTINKLLKKRKDIA